MEITRLDHIYLTVSDLAASEAFYDEVMQALKFKKGIAPIGGDPHFHYFNQYMQISIRPARSKLKFDPYAPGLHHICLEVPYKLEVDEAEEALRQIGVDTSTPQTYPEYAEDYYAIFFEDPDGIRFEIVARRSDRDLIATQWSKLEGFVNPVRRLKAKLASRDE
jgi:glyoxylase I family protein